MTKITAILPMRAGSKRIKDKNILKVNGKPLYSHILDTLIFSKRIGKIVINTDINKIDKKYLRRKKIIMLERPKSLRGNCNINLVIQDTIRRVKGEYFLETHATNPALSAKTIDRAVSEYFKRLGRYDSLFSVVKVQKRFWKKGAVPVNHDLNASPTTQDLEPYFEENSCIYIFSRKSFAVNGNRIGKRPFMFEMTVSESLDIDTADEAKLVERVLRK
jgi:CMP-N-acetylneuraminic acid synthetase